MINVNIAVMDETPRPISLSNSSTLQDLLTKSGFGDELIYKRNSETLQRTAPLFDGDFITGIPEEVKGGK